MYDPYLAEFEKSHLADETVPATKSSLNVNELSSYTNMAPIS